MEKDSRIYVAGHRGLVGSALIRQLSKQGYSNLLTRTRDELDLTSQTEVGRFFEQERPEYVLLAAAKVGGILANNTYPAEFIYQNLMIEANVIHAAYQSGVRRLLFLGSSCIYPRDVEQPMREDALLTGPLEPTNEPYAVAKIAGIKLCESYNRQYGTDYRSMMPTNLYGPGDNYHPENSHVIPALIRRFHGAKVGNAESVTVWGSGNPRREFLYVDDMAAAAIHLMTVGPSQLSTNVEPMQSHINVGTGEDISIRELADTIAQVVGFDGRIEFDKSKPDGTPRKLLDVSTLRRLGWRPKTALKEGLTKAYRAYLAEL